jgi:hypothetical protein
MAAKEFGPRPTEEMRSAIMGTMMYDVIALVMYVSFAFYPSTIDFLYGWITHKPFISSIGRSLGFGS